MGPYMQIYTIYCISCEVGFFVLQHTLQANMEIMVYNIFLIVMFKFKFKSQKKKSHKYVSGKKKKYSNTVLHTKIKKNLMPTWWLQLEYSVRTQNTQNVLCVWSCGRIHGKNRLHCSCSGMYDLVLIFGICGGPVVTVSPAWSVRVQL